MTVINTRLTVRPDGTVSLAVPLPVGEHEARIEVRDRPPRQEPTEPFDINAFPTFDLGPWPEGTTFSREEIYGDDGR